MISKHEIKSEIMKVMAGPLTWEALKKLDLLLSVCHALEAYAEDEVHEVDASHRALRSDDIHKWAARLENADGSHGPHWTIDQTTTVAHTIGVDLCRAGISPEDWYVSLNIMYSDYYPTATRYGLDSPEFYGYLAKDFLLDKDGGGADAKLAHVKALMETARM